MKVQLALAGNSADTAKFRSKLEAQGYVIRVNDDDPEAKDLAAYKTFKDSTGAIRAELRMTLDAGENVEYDGRATVNIGLPDEKAAYWFSVHSENVISKLEVYSILMTQLYGQPNQ